MELIAVHCPECPAWYDLPAGRGTPDAMWFWASPEPPDISDPSTFHGAVQMHMGHDYRVQGERFRYFYSGGAGCWVVLQYGTAHTSCGECGRELPLGSRFCGFCGHPTV